MLSFHHLTQDAVATSPTAVMMAPTSNRKGPKRGVAGGRSNFLTHSLRSFSWGLRFDFFGVEGLCRLALELSLAMVDLVDFDLFLVFFWLDVLVVGEGLLEVDFGFVAVVVFLDLEDGVLVVVEAAMAVCLVEAYVVICRVDAELACLVALLRRVI